MARKTVAEVDKNLQALEEKLEAKIAELDEKLERVAPLVQKMNDVEHALQGDRDAAQDAELQKLKTKVGNVVKKVKNEAKKARKAAKKASK